MSTVLHVQGHEPAEVERALEAIFAREERPRALRLEGTYSAVLARVTDQDLDASYRYLVLRPHGGSGWTPVQEVGNRADGLDIELSRALDGAPVFTAFVWGDVVSGYRLARHGALVDTYISDPLFFAEANGDELEVATPETLDEQRGHPERFADLLPAGTAPEDFARIVLRPGWWEAHEAGTEASAGHVGGEDTEMDEDVDEADRMRCIGLALELCGPTDYPFFEEPEELANAQAGPAIALAFA